MKKNFNLREVIESEESQFDNAWEHALYHLDIGTGVLFEEFEGRDHKKLYTKLTKIINDTARISQSIDYKCSVCGTKDILNLSGIEDFFI